MKKNIIKSLVLVITTALFMSCQEVIFDTIRNEVKLSDAKVSGDIQSITRFAISDKEYLYSANFKIWKKDVTEATNGNPTSITPSKSLWEKSSKPSDSIVKTAADSTYLYALSYTFDDDDDQVDRIITDKSLFCTKDGETWDKINFEALANAHKDFDSSVVLFCTNTPKIENRHAFINIDGKLYLLKGSNEPEEVTENDSNVYIKTSENDTSDINNAKSATKLNGKTYFSRYEGMISNETRDKDATYIYCGINDDIGYFTSGFTYFETRDPGVSSIYSIAYLKDCLLLGTNSGIEKVSFSKESGQENIPLNETSSFNSNADSTLSSYYQIFNILVVDPSKGELEGDIYGSTVFDGSSSSTAATSNNVGLWAFYKSRGKWNRE